MNILVEIPLILIFFVLTSTHEIILFIVKTFISIIKIPVSLVKIFIPKWKPAKPKKPGPKKKAVEHGVFNNVSNRDMAIILIIVLMFTAAVRIIVYGEL